MFKEGTIIDKITSFWNRRGGVVTPEPRVQAVSPWLVLNEYGRSANQQYEWEAMWKLKVNLCFLRDVYGLRVRVGRRRSEDPESAAFERWNIPSIAGEDVATLRGEIIKYPPEFIQHCRITQVRFVRGLELDGHRNWDGSSKVGGVAFDSGPIYIKNYGVEAIHHEIFHRADQESRELEDPKKQRRWKKLNRLSNPYLYDTYWNLSPERRKQLPFLGFAWCYGRTNIWEDRATVAELLMTDIRKAEARFAKDEVLDNKGKRILIDLYRWSGGRMNGRYFDDLLAGKVGEDYWR